MSEPQASPVEIIFTRGYGGVRIDAASGGRIFKGQGIGYSSAALIAALTCVPRGEIGSGRAGLSAVGFEFVSSDAPGTARYQRSAAGGLYTLSLTDDRLELTYAPADAEPRVLVSLDRDPATALWPAECASEAAHIAIALSVVHHHHDQAQSAH